MAKLPKKLPPKRGLGRPIAPPRGGRSGAARRMAGSAMPPEFSGPTSGTIGGPEPMGPPPPPMPPRPPMAPPVPEP